MIPVSRATEEGDNYELEDEEHKLGFFGFSNNNTSILLVIKPKLPFTRGKNTNMLCWLCIFLEPINFDLYRSCHTCYVDVNWWLRFEKTKTICLLKEYSSWLTAISRFLSC